ncbi:MAG: CPBP family intramembrane glutamic endopeptidase [Jatrophihabitans sp.]|uniref:CPBP family intramembrane glutamic endopeptidase n=1 Tax=Jatrophihabitans sp. TaxID=1932789 RepID=UPI003F81674F
MDVATEAPPPSRTRDRLLGLELLAVLAVTYGADGVRSLLDNIHDQLIINRGLGLKHVATGPIVYSPPPTYAWFDLTQYLVQAALGLAPAFLAVVLLARSPGGAGFSIGLDRVRRVEWLQGAGFAALIGIPGLGLVYVARQLGANAQIVVTNFPDVWYRIPVLLIDAAQNGIAEEVVVCGFVLTRLAQRGWKAPAAIGAAAVVRGGYHLYQGYGAFIGNAVMGLIFGWWFQRTRRVVPLIVAHTIIDAVSFVGYIYLKNHVSWI